MTLIAVLTYAVIQKPVQENAAETSNSDQSNSSVEQVAEGPSAAASKLKVGVYKDYSAEAVADVGYNRTIIFFYAPWCPECRSYEQAIKGSNLPDGVQILKADYDSSVDLKKKYGVTIQTSFASVNQSGGKQKLWSGYGQTKSIEAILENTK